MERIVDWQYHEQSRNAPGKSLLREENEDNGVQCLKWRHGLKIIANPGIIKKTYSSSHVKMEVVWTATFADYFCIVAII